ncbi:MAG: hypothetical protein WGN25_14290 [Candidatus Electrothrix sp. GW3-4]|uniref:LysM peptidoglycan-binding domain-containing protein n=1 Tax=Candidatus Electrothrix sp. GW3-4 TaxID=3126740 RepID=UPI0030CD300A
MSDQLTCPVCERPGIPPDSKNCPQCDADLTCFQVLETLAAKEAGKEDRSSTRRAVLLLFLLLVLIGTSFFYFSLKAKGRVQALKQRMVALQTDLQVAEQNSEQAKQVLCVLPESEKVGGEEEETFAEDDPLIYEEDLEASAKDKDMAEGHGASASKEGQQVEQTGEFRIASLTTGEPGNKRGTEAFEVRENASEKPVPEDAEVVLAEETETVSNTDEPSVELMSDVLFEEQWSEKTFLYLIKETDTLWDIAEHFYGNGKYYPVIMEQNPGLVISDIHDEESLRLFNDRTVLTDIYTRRIEWRDGLVLWKHTVWGGETQQTIEERFAAPGSSERVFYEQTPDIQPGATVRVILH